MIMMSIRRTYRESSCGSNYYHHHHLPHTVTSARLFVVCAHAALILMIIGSHPSDGGMITEFQPEFAEPIENVTVPLGRDATFTCVVRGLGGYRVGWVRADSKAIQAIHTHVITHNQRVSVSHTDHSTWHLHIKNVKEDDRGSFMCQVNTDPMIFQISYLEVVIPPDFISEETSGDVMGPEGSTLKLNCNARGHPTPNIIWKRENGQNITLKTQSGVKTQVAQYEGNVLRLHKVSRADMGVYLCIASNGVPPSISKRITVSVQFHPVIHVPNQLVGAPLNTDITLECNVEAYPRSIQFWIKDNGAMIITGDRYEVQEITNKSMFEVKMILIIRRFHRKDAGEYHCIAKNSLGDVDSVIKLYELRLTGSDDNSKGAANNLYGESEEDDDDDDEVYDTGIISAAGDIDYDNPVLVGPGKKNPYDRRRLDENMPGGGSKGKGNSISANTINSSSGTNKESGGGDRKYQLNSNNNKSKQSKNARPTGTTGNNYQQSVVVPVNAGNGGGGIGRGGTGLGNMRVVGNGCSPTTIQLQMMCTYVSVMSALIIFKILL